MDLPTLSLFLRPILTVSSVLNTRETGDMSTCANSPMLSTLWCHIYRWMPKNSIFFLKIFLQVITERLGMATGGEPYHDIRFALMAVVPDRRTELNNKLNMLRLNRSITIDALTQLVNQVPNFIRRIQFVDFLGGPICGTLFGPPSLVYINVTSFSNISYCINCE